MQSGKSKQYKPTAKIVPEGAVRKSVKGGTHTANRYTDPTKTYQYKHFNDTGKLDPTRPIPRTRGVNDTPVIRKGKTYARGNNINFNKGNRSNGGSVPAHSGKPRIKSTALQEAALRKLKGGPV